MEAESDLAIEQHCTKPEAENASKRPECNIQSNTILLKYKLRDVCMHIAVRGEGPTGCPVPLTKAPPRTQIRCQQALRQLVLSTRHHLCKFLITGML